MRIHIRKESSGAGEDLMGFVIQSGLDDGTLDTATYDDVVEEVIDSVRILTVKSNGRKYHQPLDAGIIHEDMISWSCDGVIENAEMVDRMLNEYSKGLVLYRQGHPLDAGEWWARLSDGVNVSIDYSVDEFDPLVIPSIRKLVNEYLLGDSDSIYMDGPDSVIFIKNDVVKVQKDMNFGSVDAYHHVIDKFILQPSNIAGTIVDGTTPLLAGHLTFGDGLDKVSLARVHVMVKPFIKVARVTITKNSLENKNPSSYGKVLASIHSLLDTLNGK